MRASCFLVTGVAPYTVCPLFLLSALVLDRRVSLDEYICYDFREAS